MKPKSIQFQSVSGRQKVAKTNSTSRQLPLALLLAGAGMVASATAADVTMTSDDLFGASSFNSAGHWSSLAAPTTGNAYLTENRTLRTPATAGTFNFAGDSISVDAGGRFLGKGGGTNTSQTISVPNLILNGGTFDQAGNTGTTGAVMTVTGNITVAASSFIGAIALNANNTPNFETLEITANISGSEPLTVAGFSNLSQNRGVVRLNSANTFTGSLDVIDPGFIASATHRLLQLNHRDALRFATLGLLSTQPNPLSFAAAANTGPFRVGALSGNAAQTLTDTANQPVTLEAGASGADTFYSGALRGTGNLTKVGTGNLTLHAANTFTGVLKIQEGIVTLDVAGSLHTSSTVDMAPGAVLEIYTGVPVVVKALVLNGVTQPAGIYTPETPGGFIGFGELHVSTGDPLPQNILLTGNDGFGTSSFNTAGLWSDGEPPAALNHYFTQGFVLRTPNVAGSFTFGGASLSVDANSRLLGKGAGVAGSQQTITVNNLVLNGGSLEQAGNPLPDVVLTVQGNINVTAASILGALGADAANDPTFETLEISAPISGSAPLQVAGTTNASANRGVVRLNAANPYSGTISILQPSQITSATHRLLQLNHLDALRHATLSLGTTTPNGLSFAAAANTGNFRIAGLTGTATQTLADTVGAPVTLDVGEDNGSSTFDGTLDGAGTLRKSGTGTLVYAGGSLATNGVSVSKGTLELSQASLGDGSTVSVVTGGVLRLAHDGTDVVRALVLNGTSQPEGFYTAANTGGLVTSTGTGRIQVVASTGFDAFMDSFPGLSAADKAADADPDDDGIANLMEYALAGFNPTVPDTLPGLSGSTVSFTKRPLAVSNGDVGYFIEVSPTLGMAPQPWAVVNPDVDDGTTISYALPAGLPRNFVRLRVDAND